jgi:EAL domain-containing protein (putative c-di-GMP-specific phosphodiesterase class I)
VSDILDSQLAREAEPIAGWLGVLAASDQQTLLRNLAVAVSLNCPGIGVGVAQIDRSGLQMLAVVGDAHIDDRDLPTLVRVAQAGVIARHKVHVAETEDGITTWALIAPTGTPDGPIVVVTGDERDLDEQVARAASMAAEIAGAVLRRPTTSAADSRTGLVDEASLRATLEYRATLPGLLAVFEAPGASELVDEAASALRSALRPDDLVGQLADLRFVVAVGGLEVPGDATRVVSRLRERLVGVAGHPVLAGAVVWANQTSHTDLVERAAGQLDLAAIARDGLAIEGDRDDGTWAVTPSLCAHALEAGEIVPWFQPLRDMTDGRLIGAEALARWERAGQLVSPSTFLAGLEKGGALSELTRRMLDQTAEVISFWEAQGLLDDRFSVAVNCDVSELESGAIVEAITDVLDRSRIPAHRLGIEVTEATQLSNRSAATTSLRRIRDLGVCVSLDDFGTGYSSLSTLHHLPVDIVKIDRSFVRGLPDRGSEAIIQAILDVASTMDLRVIAEGVETEEQQEALLALGVTWGQGFLLGRPAPVEAFELGT